MFHICMVPFDIRLEYLYCVAEATAHNPVCHVNFANHYILNDIINDKSYMYVLLVVYENAPHGIKAHSFCYHITASFSDYKMTCHLWSHCHITDFDK